MKFRFPLVMVLVVLIFTIIAAPVSAQIADGTYQVNYQVKHASNDNASIADGYFTKPASVTVANGVSTVTITLTGADMIKSLSGPSGPVTVVSEDTASNTRVVKFTANNLAQAQTMKMKISVPDLYDQEHSARLVFNTSDLPQAGATGSSNTNSGTNATAAGGEVVENPKTGENSSIALYAALMVASVIGLVAIRKFRPARD